MEFSLHDLWLKIVEGWTWLIHVDLIEVLFVVGFWLSAIVILVLLKKPAVYLEQLKFVAWYKAKLSSPLYFLPAILGVILFAVGLGLVIGLLLN